MAGTIKISDSKNWTASSGLFYWAILVIAEQIESYPNLRQTLLEIESENLGYFDVNELSTEQQTAVYTIIRNLPSIGRERLLYAKGKPTPYIDQLNELASLIS